MSTDQLPLKEWIVIFYPNTGAVRLCPTLDFARNTVSGSTYYTNVYKSPNDLRVKHDHATLEKAWKEVYKTASWRFPKTATGKLEDYTATPPDVDTETFSKMLWEFIQDVGDRLMAPMMSGTKSQTKEKYELKLGEMKKLIFDEKAFKEKYNNQARTVFEALYYNNEQFLNEEEIKVIILGLVAERKLKTRQKPWVIFQYYRPEFIKGGFVIRGRVPKTERLGDDD